MPRFSALSALVAAVEGDVLAPGTDAYESARRPVSAQFWDREPAAIVLCRSSDDVARAIGYARQHEVAVAVRSGGHCFAGRSSTDGILLDVSPMDSISVSGRTVTVGAGARLGALGDALHGYGVALPTGCGRSVGIAGLTLGGGLGILGRLHGLTSDQLLAAQVVLADGRVVDCDEANNPDLFWALRGAGGGHFGVATSLVLRTVPAPEVTIFSLSWPLDCAADLVAAWVERAPAAVDELSANLRLSVSAEFGEPPTMSLEGTMCADRTTTVQQVGELTASVVTEPLATGWHSMPYAPAKRILDESPVDAPETAQAELIHRKSELFPTDLPGAAIADLVQTLTSQRRPGQAREISFLPLGGAYNRVPSATTAFAHRNQRFLVEHLAAVGLSAPIAEQQAAQAWVFRSWSTIHSWGSGRVYPNFPDLTLTNWADAYWAGNTQRLRELKRRFDPDGVFRPVQSL